MFTYSISDSHSHWPRIATLNFLMITMLTAGCSLRAPSWPVVAELDFSAACAGNRWIGVLKEQQQKKEKEQQQKEEQSELGNDRRLCPDGWEHLFTNQTELPPGLQRFCLYEGPDPRKELSVINEQGRAIYKTGAPIDRENNNKKQQVVFFEEISQDCRVVGPAAETLFPPIDLGRDLNDRFLQEVRVAESPLSGKKVRLVLIDSVKDSEGPDNEACPRQTESTEKVQRQCSSHGWVLAKLARELLGNDAKIASRQALTRTYEIRQARSGPKEVRLAFAQETGGLYGHWSDLGDAITRAVNAWQKGVGRPEGAERPKLILNLSVGWEAIYGADIAAVRRPIEVAVCQGVLVVAAAGNRRAGPPALEEPILPAAWEQVPAPTEKRCEFLLGEPPSSYALNSDYRPLLYAVGGVTRDGQILSNSKPRATPRLVAFGDHASVVDNRTSQSRLKTLTGTSVSALVVSAAAAALWSKDPSLSSFELMQKLWQAGGGYATTYPVRQYVDFCWEPIANCPPGTPARRIFVAPPTSGPMNTFRGSLDPPTMSEADLPINHKLMDAKLVKLTPFSKFENVVTCDPQVLAYKKKPSRKANRCPQRWPFDITAQPWLGPQPESTHNSDCRYTATSPGTLVLEFDPCYRIEGMPAELDNFTLVSGDVAYRLPINKFTLGGLDQPCPLENDDRRKQVVLSGFLFEGLYPMYLAVTVNGEHATISPILQVLKKDQ